MEPDLILLEPRHRRLPRVVPLATALAALTAALAGPAHGATPPAGFCGVITGATWHSTGAPYGTQSGNRWIVTEKGGVACSVAKSWSARLSREHSTTVKPLPGPAGFTCFAPSSLIGSCVAGNGSRVFEWTADATRH
jgi:hypothetical protein